MSGKANNLHHGENWVGVCKALCALEVNGSMEKRWGISIDIEGFSNLYEYSDSTRTKAIWGLHQLMEAVIKGGTESLSWGSK